MLKTVFYIMTDFQFEEIVKGSNILSSYKRFLIYLRSRIVLHGSLTINVANNLRESSLLSRAIKMGIIEASICISTSGWKSNVDLLQFDLITDRGSILIPQHYNKYLIHWEDADKLIAELSA